LIKKIAAGEKKETRRKEEKKNGNTDESNSKTRSRKPGVVQKGTRAVLPPPKYS
jgi:hypothetical protein